LELGVLGENGDDYGYIIARIAQMAGGSQAFASESGHCGLVPGHARKGDLICVLFGCDVPVIIRKVEEHYIFIGESYV
jgi:hypothetical protein